MRISQGNQHAGLNLHPTHTRISDRNRLSRTNIFPSNGTYSGLPGTYSQRQFQPYQNIQGQTHVSSRGTHHQSFYSPRQHYTPATSTIPPVHVIGQSSHRVISNSTANLSPVRRLSPVISFLTQTRIANQVVTPPIQRNGVVFQGPSTLSTPRLHAQPVVRGSIEHTIAPTSHVQSVLLPQAVPTPHVVGSHPHNPGFYVVDERGQKVYLPDLRPETLERFRHLGSKFHRHPLPRPTTGGGIRTVVSRPISASRSGGSRSVLSSPREGSMFASRHNNN